MFSPVTITKRNGWQRREMFEKMQRNTCERLPCPGLSSLQVEKIPHEAVWRRGELDTVSFSSHCCTILQGCLRLCEQSWWYHKSAIICQIGELCTWVRLQLGTEVGPSSGDQLDRGNDLTCLALLYLPATNQPTPPVFFPLELYTCPPGGLINHCPWMNGPSSYSVVQRLAQWKSQFAIDSVKGTNHAFLFSESSPFSLPLSS